MSLTVSPALLDQARHGDVDDAAFTACIQGSLPYAWQLVSELAGQLRTAGGGLADNQGPPGGGRQGGYPRRSAYPSPARSAQAGGLQERTSDDPVAGLVGMLVGPAGRGGALPGPLTQPGDVARDVRSRWPGEVGGLERAEHVRDP